MHHYPYLFVFVIFVCISYHPKPENVSSYIHSTWARSFCRFSLAFSSNCFLLLNKMRTHLNLRMRTQIWHLERGVPFASEGFKFFNAWSERTCVPLQRHFTLHDHDVVVNRPLVQEAPISKKKTAAKITSHPADDNGSIVSRRKEHQKPRHT